MLWKSKIPDMILLGDEVDKYKILSDYKPAILCFGYDQHTNENAILDYCLKHGFIPEIYRIDSYKPELHKSSIKKKQRKYNSPKYI